MSPSIEANVKLAALLRECAGYVEQNEFHPSIYKALGGLHEYAAQANVPDVTPAPEVKQQQQQQQQQQHEIKNEAKTEVSVTKPYVMPGGLGSGLGALGKQFKKGLGLSQAPSASDAAAAAARHQATSTKNADRIKADLMGSSSNNKTATARHHHHDDWCDVHFVMGCACKSRPGSALPVASIQTTTTTTPSPKASAKQAFSRPTNPSTNLIANGWIEQQRRSKMRIVWKEILASLVEGRKPGEETTLWIQREVTNSTTGRTELEALHQIPVKWLEDVKYLDFYGDHRFSIKVYNIAEEFLFKCANEDAAQNWVLTLLSIKEIVNNKTNRVEERPAGDSPLASAIAATTTTTSRATTPTNTVATNSNGVAHTTNKMSIKELRAIAHGAGINTAGMERSDLERAVAEIPCNGKRAEQEVETEKANREEDEVLRRRLEEQQRQRTAATATANVRKAADEAALKRLAERQATERQTAERQAAERQAAERQAAERQAAERQRSEEEQRLLWQQQAEQRKRQDDALLAEAARLEAVRQQAAREEAARQQWAQQQAAQQAYAAQQHQWQQQQAAAQAQARAAQQQAWQAQQQQQQQYRAQQSKQFPPAGAPPPQPAPPPPKPPNSGQGSSSVNQKYAQMATGGDGDGQAAITNIKRNILVHWALQPPMLQSLRPIHLLLSSVHTVFPPAFGVPGHAYFVKWKAITIAELGGAHPDEEKLKKAVKQLRFFLHPDKLPKDLSEEQTFMCKMLWDVANDSWEEHHKKKEDLDWIKH